MTAYEVIQQHPEWATSEKVPRAAIQERAKRYVSDYKGNGNFAKGVTKDLDDLLRRRDATNDFAGIVVNGDTPQVNTECPEYLADKRKAKICAIFVKAVISELAGRSICTTAQIQEWRERYGVKLEGLQGKSKKKTKEFEPIGLDEESVTSIYNCLRQKGKIECSEDDFIWYYGKKQDRQFAAQPKPIKWKGDKKEFAVLCMCIQYRIKKSFYQVPWRAYHYITGYILRGDNPKYDPLRAAAKDVKSGEPLPQEDYLAEILHAGYKKISEYACNKMGQNSYNSNIV